MSWLVEVEAENAAKRARLEAEAARITEALTRMPGVRKVLLFGSLARGAADRRSDLDLIVIQETTLPFLERSRAIFNYARPEVAVDLLVYTPSEFEEIRERVFFRQALADAVVLHEAPGA